MSNVVEFSFNYKHLDFIDDLVIEATYTIQKPDFYSKESDWDYNGFQTLEHYSVFNNEVQIFIDIPEDVLYHHLREHLRDLEISGCMSRETGGF